MNSCDYLDAVKKKHGLRSDYQLGKFLGWGHSRISNYRAGKTQFDETACLEIAEALEVNPLTVMADINAERAKDSAVKTFWQEVAKLAHKGMITTAFAGLSFFTAGTFAPPVHAVPTGDNAGSVYYVKY